MIPEVDQRLARWGEYMRTSRDFGLGYPKRNILHKAMREGAGAGQGGYRGGEPVPPDVEATEAALCGLSDGLKAVVNQKYVECCPDKIGAQRCKISLDKYRRRIDQIHYYVAGQMGVDIDIYA